MKISINNAEALKIVTEHFRNVFPGETLELTINENEQLHAAGKNVLTHISRLNYLGNQKIEAIQFLRSSVPGMGLADAKYAIEDFANYCRKCEAAGNLIGSWNH